MTVDPSTRNANRWLFIGLVCFAILFCAAILWWMRGVTIKRGGRVYPPTPTPSSWVIPAKPTLAFCANFSSPYLHVL